MQFTMSWTTWSSYIVSSYSNVSPHFKGHCVSHYVLVHKENPLFYHPLLNLPIPLLIIPSHLPLKNPLPTLHYCMLIYTFIQYLLSMLYISLLYHSKKYTTCFCILFFTQLCNFVQEILLTSAPRIGKTL